MRRRQSCPSISADISASSSGKPTATVAAVTTSCDSAANAKAPRHEMIIAHVVFRLYTRSTTTKRTEKQVQCNCGICGWSGTKHQICICIQKKFWTTGNLNLYCIKNLTKKQKNDKKKKTSQKNSKKTSKNFKNQKNSKNKEYCSHLLFSSVLSLSLSLFSVFFRCLSLSLSVLVSV